MNDVNGVVVIARYEAIPNKLVISEIDSFVAITDTLSSKNANGRLPACRLPFAHIFYSPLPGNQ